MNDKNSTKINTSSLQVLKTLQVLLEDNYTMSELVAILNKGEEKPIFNNGVVSKYINTCRYCGFNIPKINNKYYVANIPFGLDLSQKDLDNLEYLNHVVQERMTKKYSNIFAEFVNRLNRYSNKGILKLEEKTSKVIYEAFEDGIKDKRKLKFILKNKKTLECIPIKLIDEKRPSRFLVSENGKERMISVNSVAAIETSDTRYIENFTQQSVTFKLTGGLAKRYTLRDWEDIIERKENEIIVSNKGECKELLLKRLLKYDTCCEVLTPKSYRIEMYELIKSTLKNYGEE